MMKRTITVTSATRYVILFVVLIIKAWGYGEVLNAQTQDCGPENEPSAVKATLKNGVLWVSGKGAIGDNRSPWYNVKESITDLVIEDGVTHIGSYTFSDYTNLMSITIPSSVRSIGERAFIGCANLASITIPGSVRSIGEWAFYECTGLTSVTIRSGVTSIGEGAFLGCKSLTSVTIPGSVITIGKNAFLGCKSLTSVTIPSSMRSIGETAFSGCTSLTSINVSKDNLAYSSVGGVLFNKAQDTLIQYPPRKQGAAYTIPNSVTTVEDGAFSYCASLTSVTIPSGVTEIKHGIFRNCIGLTSIIIPHSVTSIGNYVFEGCANLTSIDVNENNSKYSSVDGVLFDKAKRILIKYPEGKQGATYTIPKSVSTIESEAFINVDLTSITIPYNVGIIDAGTFTGARLTSITIPNWVKTIETSVFRDCIGLTSVTIPGSVKIIQSGAFQGCTSLTSVTIPSSVIYIGRYAFSSCKSLTSVIIPDSVTSIKTGAFSYCTRLTSINVSKDNPKYSSVNGVLFNKTQDCLLQYPGGKQGVTYTIPKNVTTIEKSAFAGNGLLTSITIPDSVRIGEYAFAYCTSLTSITIHGSAITDGNLFHGCTNLTSVIFGDRVKHITDDIFSNCTSLTSVTSLNPVPPRVWREIFNPLPSSACLYVPASSIAAYRAAEGWEKFKCIKDLESAPSKGK